LPSSVWATALLDAYGFHRYRDEDVAFASDRVPPWVFFSRRRAE
jgi:hypothetical protein